MTNDEIIEMAKQTGFYAPDAQHKGMLIAFARLIAEKQREEDAHLCELTKYGSTLNLATGIVSCGCAAAIRGQK